MVNWGWKKAIIVAFILLMSVPEAWAKEPLLIVTDQWPPYVMKVDGIVKGADAEITQAVFQELGIAVNIKLYPWKRCLLMVEHGLADAVLDASITPEREKNLYFPKEPLSNGITVFFIKRGRAVPFKTLEDLNRLRVGAILGYSYCDEIDHTPFMQNSERVQSLKQNFDKLLAGRLDAVAAVYFVGYFTANQMGISDQITIIPNAMYCHGGNYLAFSRKPGYDRAASQFSAALQAFKKTNTYKQILARYGIIDVF